MEQAVNPVRDKIKIRNFRSTEKLLIVETDTVEDAEKLCKLDSLLKENITVEPPRKKNPLMIIYDLPSSKTNEEITKTLYHQNFEECMNMDEFNNKFKLRFKTGPREREIVHHVAEVSSDLRKIIMKKSRIYHQFTSHNVRDFIVVPRCLKCQDLGHVRKYCRAEKEVCMHCGEHDHVKSDCDKKNQPPTCVPCQIRKKKCTPGGKDCPSFKIMWERHVSRIDYG